MLLVTGPMGQTQGWRERLFTILPEVLNKIYTGALESVLLLQMCCLA